MSILRMEPSVVCGMTPTKDNDFVWIAEVSPKFVGLPWVSHVYDGDVLEIRKFSVLPEKIALDIVRLGNKGIN